MKSAPLLLLGSVIVFTAGSARAAIVLAVDFGRSDAGSLLVEPGFSAFHITGANRDPGVTETQTFGAFSVSVFPANVDAGNRGASGRDRGAPLDTGSFTYGDLLRDLVTRIAQGDVSGNPVESMRITGLAPLTQYTLQLWALDTGSGADNEVSEWYNMSSGSNIFLGNITNDTTSPVVTSNNDFSILVPVTTSAAGELRIGSVFPASQGQINGFTLDLVPEPSTGVLALAAGVFTFQRRQRLRR